MKMIKTISLALLGIVLCAFFSACGDKNSVSTEQHEHFEVEGWNLYWSEWDLAYSVYRGKADTSLKALHVNANCMSEHIHVKFLDENKKEVAGPKDDEHSLGWDVGDKKILDIHWEGGWGFHLKGLKEGIASFIVRTADGSLQTRGWVNVVDKRVFPTGANFLIDQSYAVGSSIKVKYYSSSGYPRIEWTPADANDLDFDLTSEDESIVSVKPDWYNSYDVYFLKAGTTTLKFWSYIYETGTSFRKDVDIHVYNGNPNLSYDYSDMTFWSGWTLCLIPDGLTGKIDLKFENIYDRNFVITNANEFAEYITVSSNRVTAKKVGKTTISLRARSDPSHTLNIPVTIFDRPTDLSFGLASDNEVIEVKKGAEQIIYVYTKPESSIGRYNVSTSSGHLSAEMKPGIREQKPFTPMPDNFKTLKLKAGNVTGLFTVTLTHKDNSSVKKTLNVRVIN